MTLFADSEGLDQTARMRSLILAFDVRICLETRFRMDHMISRVRIVNVQLFRKIMVYYKATLVYKELDANCNIRNCILNPAGKQRWNNVVSTLIRH